MASPLSLFGSSGRVLFLAAGLVVLIATAKATAPSTSLTTTADTRSPRLMAEAIAKNEHATLIERSGGFEIVYLVPFDKFLLSITGQPFTDARARAEATFLARYANGDKNRACSLHVVVTTPNFANPDHAIQEYPLSFCTP